MKMDIVLSETTEYAMRASLSDLIKRAVENPFEEYIVLAPETKTLFVERFLLDNIPSHAFSNIFVYSFSRLLKRLQTVPVLPLSKQAGVMIVRNIIMEVQDDFVCYKKTAKTVGFAENIYETIQQLKSSGITPLELSEAVEKCPTALKIKLKDICLLYDSYQRYLEEGLIDPSDKLALLETQVETSERIKNSNVFIVGFDSLTANMASVIKNICKNAKYMQVSASFIHKERKNSHIADNEVFEKYKQIAEKLGIKYQPKLVSKPLVGDFKHIMENLYCYPAIKKETSGQINIFGCPLISLEAKKVGSLIREDIYSGKYRYKDICIYLANPDLKNDVEKALKEFEIPYFSAEPYQFEEHPLFVFIKLLFQSVKRNFEAEDIINLSKLALLNLDKNEVYDFENYCLAYGINHARFAKPFLISDPLLENAEKVRQEVMSVVNKFIEIYDENLTVFELIDGVFAFFDWFEMEKRLENLKNTQNKNNDIREAMATEQAYKKAVEVLKMLSQFLGSRKLKLEDLYTLLISGLEANDINLLPLSIDMVQVVENPDGLYNIKKLYIVGATDGNFPKREQDLGLIQDSEITSLEGISEKKIEPTIRTINRRERFKIFELLNLPTDKLTISFSERSNGGEEEKMSALVLALAELFLQSGEEFRIERIYTPFVEDKSAKELAISLAVKTEAINYLAETLQKYRSGQDFSAGNKNIHSLYKAVQEFASDEIRGYFEEINQEADTKNIENAKDLYFSRGTTSISELESYFNCPFKHFVDYGLRLKERKLAGMKAMDVGDVLHEVVEKFVHHYLTHKEFDADKLALNLLNKVLEENKYDKDENAVLINILKDESKRLIKALCDQLSHSSFAPFALEKRFGSDEIAGIKIHQNPDISIVGKIDRADQNDKYYRIIDYKTGKIDTSSEDIYYGHKLQLAIYLSALSKIKKQPAGVLYFPVHNEYKDSEENAIDAYKMKGFLLGEEDALLAMDTTLGLESPKSHYIGVELKTSKQHRDSGKIEFKQNDALLTADELENMSIYAKKLAENGVKEILEGYHKPSPFAKNNFSKPCEYCSFKSVCGIVEDEYKSLRGVNLLGAKEFYKGEQAWQKK